MKRKIYYVSIDGRVNTIHLSIRNKHVHHEIVVTTSQAKAKEIAWNNLQCDMDDADKHCYGRRDFKIECEDWTDCPEIIRDGDYYFTYDGGAE